VNEADSIGRRIARARKLREKPLTQAGLAVIVPCSKSLIAQVERGHKPATPALIAAVARALNIDVTELTGQPYGAGNGHPPEQIHLAIPQICSLWRSSGWPGRPPTPTIRYCVRWRPCAGRRRSWLPVPGKAACHCWTAPAVTWATAAWATLPH
jgi:transcriptional regulator with XRE-family HTH domain